MEDFIDDNETPEAQALPSEEEKPGEELIDKQRFVGDVILIDFEELLKNKNLDTLSQELTGMVLEHDDFMKKDIIDRFIDFVILKVSTGRVVIPSLAYPTKEMHDKELEKKIIALINVYLYPEIVFRILKFFARNIYDSDTNLYLANLIHSEEIIRSIFNTYVLIKKDILITDPEKRTLNVKRIQQFPKHSDNSRSSPLDTAARFKYILEFLALKNRVDHIYSHDDLLLSRTEKKVE